MNSQMRDSNPLVMKAPPANGKLLSLPASQGVSAEMRPTRKLTGEVASFETDEYGFITMWSVKAEQVYGYESDEIVGKHIASLYPTADLQYGMPIHDLQAAASIKHNSYFNFGWQKRRNGQEFWAYAEFQSIKDANNQLVGYRKFVVETSTSVSK